jgi:hypothetical protein
LEQGMNKDADLDKEISRLVRSLEVQVPPAVDERISAAAVRAHHTQAGSSVRRLWFPAVISAAVAGLALIALLKEPSGIPQTSPPITEIRTQFELVNKNIMVIFIQKPDFVLKEDINE